MLKKSFGISKEIYINVMNLSRVETDELNILKRILLSEND